MSRFRNLVFVGAPMSFPRGPKTTYKYKKYLINYKVLLGYSEYDMPLVDYYDYQFLGIHWWKIRLSIELSFTDKLILLMKRF